MWYKCYCLQITKTIQFPGGAQTLRKTNKTRINVHYRGSIDHGCSARELKWMRQYLRETFGYDIGNRGDKKYADLGNHVPADI